MSAEIGLHHAPIGHVIGLIFRACNLVDNYFFFSLKIALGQAWIHHIAEQLDGTLQVLTQYSRIIDGGFMGGKSVEFRAYFVKLQRNLLPVERLGALEHHMLQKM